MPTKHEAWLKATQAAAGSPDLLKQIGPEPPSAPPGELISITTQSGGLPLFWQGGVKAVGETTLETVADYREEDTVILIQRRVGTFEGSGAFNLDFLLYYWMGYDLSSASKSTIETLRLPPRLLMPFLVLVVVSLFTRRERDEVLDRYYTKMRTPVHPDPETDRRLLAAAFTDPQGNESRRLFPGSDWQFVKPTGTDVAGFLISVAICFAIVGLLAWLAGVGAS